MGEVGLVVAGGRGLGEAGLVVAEGEGLGEAGLVVALGVGLGEAGLALVGEVGVSGAWSGVGLMGKRSRAEERLRGEDGRRGGEGTVLMGVEWAARAAARAAWIMGAASQVSRVVPKVGLAGGGGACMAVTAAALAACSTGSVGHWSAGVTVGRVRDFVSGAEKGIPCSAAIA